MGMVEPPNDVPEVQQRSARRQLAGPRVGAGIAAQATGEEPNSAPAGSYAACTNHQVVDPPPVVARDPHRITLSLWRPLDALPATESPSEQALNQNRGNDGPTTVPYSVR